MKRILCPTAESRGLRFLRPLRGHCRAVEIRGAADRAQGSSRRLGDDIVAVAGVPDADWIVFRSGRADVMQFGSRLRSGPSPTQAVPFH